MNKDIIHMPSFDVKYKSINGFARVGEIKTSHGTINTPAFVFCATHGTMKSMTMEQLVNCETQIALSNTYHLMIHGLDMIDSLGGLHKAIRCSLPMMTDSGGYQIFAMASGSVSRDINGKMNNLAEPEIKPKNGEIKGSRDKSWEPTLLSITENGATFRSYYDRSKQLLTPERSIKIQKILGADLIYAFDECTPYNKDKEYTEASMYRSHRWGIRCLRELSNSLDDRIYPNNDQGLYGIIQGGVYDDLRYISVSLTLKEQYFGTAIGGSLGDSTEMMHDTVTMTCKHIRDVTEKLHDVVHRPIHLLGIGGISDIFHGVRQGIDTFDCVHPTRIARHGCALIKQSINSEYICLTKGKYYHDNTVIDDKCECDTCKGGYSRAYLSYLLKIKETTAGVLITIHNVYFMNRLMAEIRNAILNNCLDELEYEYTHKAT